MLPSPSYLRDIKVFEGLEGTAGERGAIEGDESIGPTGMVKYRSSQVYPCPQWVVVCIHNAKAVHTDLKIHELSDTGFQWILFSLWKCTGSLPAGNRPAQIWIVIRHTLSPLLTPSLTHTAKDALEVSCVGECITPEVLWKNHHQGLQLLLSGLVLLDVRVV